MRPGKKPTRLEEMSQANKQIVIYVDQNPEKSAEDWQKILTEIELAFIENKIIPRAVLGGRTERQVGGSRYFTYRNSASSANKAEAVYQRVALSSAYNDAGWDDSFENMTIDTPKPSDSVGFK